MPRKPGAPTAPFTGPRKRGPNTPEGKLRSSMNSFKTGKYARSLFVLRHEDLPAFEALVDSLARRYKPQDDVEYRLVRQLAAVEWRLDRVFALDTGVTDREFAIQTAALQQSSPHAVPDPVALGIVTHNLLENSKLPYFLGTREAQLLNARTQIVQHLERLRKTQPLAAPCSQIYVPTDLSFDNSFSSEFETNSTGDPAPDQPESTQPLDIPEAA